MAYNFFSWLPWFQEEEKVKPPPGFPLASFPPNLLARTIEKMQCKELNALRRSCSQAEKFIEKYKMTIGIPVKWRKLMYDNGKLFFNSSTNFSRIELTEQMEKNLAGIRLESHFCVSFISSQEEVEKVIKIASIIKCKGISFLHVPQELVTQILARIKPLTIAVQGRNYNGKQLYYTEDLTRVRGFETARLVVINDVLVVDTRFMKREQRIFLKGSDTVKLVNKMLKDFQSGTSTPASYIVLNSEKYHSSISPDKLFAGLRYSLEWSLESHKKTLLASTKPSDIYFQWKSFSKAQIPAEVCLYSIPLPSGEIVAVGTCASLSSRLHLKTFSSREEMFDSFLSNSWELDKVSSC